MKNVKIIIAVVALVAAVAIAFMTGGKTDTALTTREESRTSWMCAECKHPFQLTAAQVEEESRTGTVPPVTCPSCKQRRAMIAMVCEKCGTYFFNRDVEGSTGACPKCEPDAAPPSEEKLYESLPEEARPKEEELYETDPTSGVKKKKTVIKGA